MVRWLAIAGMMGVLATVRCAAADWKEPADKIFTEDQLNTYIATENDWLDVNAKIMQAVSDAKTAADRIAAVADISAKQQACYDRHHISADEFNWIAQQSIVAYSYVKYVDDAYAKSKADLEQKAKDNDDKLADAQKRLATYEEAEKDGRRVMTPEDRDAAIKAAKADQQAALDDAKMHDDEINITETEAKQHDSDADAADALAASPPRDVSDADRQNYIDGKKTDAQTARDAAKEARSREADAKKAKDDAMAKADAAGLRLEHPDVPVTDDEKAALKTDNDAAIASAQSDANNCMQTRETIAMNEAQLKQSMDQIQKDVPAANVEIMRKHTKEYADLFERIGRNGAATQPAQ